MTARGRPAIGRAPRVASYRAAASSSTASIAGAAGTRRAPAGVAAITWRTGGRGESARIAMSSRTTDSASSGISATPTPAATRPWTVW